MGKNLKSANYLQIRKNIKIVIRYVSFKPDQNRSKLRSDWPIILRLLIWMVIKLNRSFQLTTLNFAYMYIHVD